MTYDYKAIGKKFNAMVNGGTLSEDVVLKRLKIDDITGVITKLKTLDPDSLETVLDLFGLNIVDFSVETKPETENKTKTTKPIPKIFTKQLTDKPSFNNVTELTEHLVKLLDLVKLPENMSVIFDDHFLHLSHSQGDKSSVSVNGVKCESQFYVTKAVNPKTNCNIYQDYDPSNQDDVHKSWSKFYQCFGHIAELLALSEYIKQAAINYMNSMSDDIDQNKAKIFRNAIIKSVKTEVSTWEQPERNWLTLNVFNLMYDFSKIKFLKSENLNGSYANVPFIGGGDKTDKPNIVSLEYVQNLLESKPVTDQSKPVTKPVTDQSKPFVKPNGSDEIIEILQSYKKIPSDFSLDSDSKLKVVLSFSQKLITELTEANKSVGFNTKKLNCELIDTLESYLSANK